MNDPPFTQASNQDAVVWSIDAFAPDLEFFKSIEDLDLMLAARKKNVNILYFPYHTTPRMSAQQGCFTVHSLPLSTEEEFVPLEVQFNKGDRSILPTKYIIPASSRPSIAKELDTLGINYFTLFPDLDGLSQKLIRDVFYAETWFKD